jgi:hypothetical protein
MAQIIRRDPSYKRGLPKPQETPAYLTDFTNYDTVLIGMVGGIPLDTDSTHTVIASLDSLDKPRLRDATNALIADYIESGGQITCWPKGYRVLTTSEAAAVETIALGVGYTSDCPLPSRHTFKAPRRIRRFALRRG